MEMVREQLQCFDFSQNYYSNVTYHNIETVNYYRSERPYRLFKIPGSSKVTMQFGLSGAENVSTITLNLNHCRTTADGIVNIALNGVWIIRNFQAPRDNFGWESFNFPAANFEPEKNELTIQLHPESPGVYWLSDATIHIERRIDEKEADIDQTGKDLFVLVKNLVDAKRKVVQNLRGIAEDLDHLHRTANEWKIGGTATRLGGNLLMLGGAALEILSLGGATPIAVMMENAGLVLHYGGLVVESGANIWETVEDQSDFKEFHRSLENDKQHSRKLGETAQKFQAHMKLQERTDFPASTLITARMMMSICGNVGGLTSQIEEVSWKPGFSKIASVLQAAEQNTLRRIARVCGVGFPAVLTVQDLMKEIADMSKGSPSEMAINVRKAVAVLDKDISEMHHFMEDSFTSFLEKLQKELQSSNLLSVGKMMGNLEIFQSFSSRYGEVQNSNLADERLRNYLSKLNVGEGDFLANTIYQVYMEIRRRLREQLDKDQDEGEMQVEGRTKVVDLVIVAHGSVGLPINSTDRIPNPWPVTIPPEWCFATEYLSSLTFYQPWGVLIDAIANNGIVRGSIHPSQVRFNLGRDRVYLPGIPTRFNVLEQQFLISEKIPTAWCNPIDDGDQSLSDLQSRIIQGVPTPHQLTRPYVWYRGPSIPAFILTSVSSIAAMLLSIETGCQLDLRIHNGFCLNWPFIDTEPPAEMVAVTQYYNVIGRTYQQPLSMTLNELT